MTDQSRIKKIDDLNAMMKPYDFTVAEFKSGLCVSCGGTHAITHGRCVSATLALV